MSRLSLDIVKSFLGACLIIKDNETGKSAEIMAMQLQSFNRSGDTTGSLPHGGIHRDGDNITVHHDEDRENHEVTFTMKEIVELVNSREVS